MKVGRNDPCPCGSGKKYKKCCLEKEEQTLMNQVHESRYVSEVDEWEPEDEEMKDDLTDNFVEEPDDDFDEESFDNEDETDQPDDETAELPEISEEENKLVDDWWEEYIQMNDTVKEREHLVAFMNQYPHLTDHLGLWYEALFDLGSDHFRQGIYEIFVELLLRIRKEFPFTYKQSFEFYDCDLSYWFAAQGRWDEIDTFFSLFGEFGDNYGSKLNTLITFFKAFNRSEIPLKLLKDSKSHDAIISIIENNIESRYLDIPVTDDSVQSLADEMTAADVINNDYSKEELLKEWKQQLLQYTRPFIPWKEQLPKKRSQVFKYYLSITNNFAYFLYKKYGLSFVTAHEYSDSISDYYSRIVSEKKYPDSLFCLDPKQLSKHSKMGRGFWLDSRIDTFIQLNAFYYFVDYLKTCGNVSEDQQREMQEMIANFYDETYQKSKDNGPEMLLFAKFPLWKMKE